MGLGLCPGKRRVCRPLAWQRQRLGRRGMGVGRTGPGPILHPSLMGTKPPTVPASRVKRRSAWVLVAFSTSSRSSPTTTAADPHQPGLETDIGPAQSAGLASPGAGGGGQSERGGELGVVVAGIDEPLPVGRRRGDRSPVVHRRRRRKRGWIAIDPAHLRAAPEPREHGVDLANGRRRETLALAQPHVEVVDLGTGESRNSDVADGRQQVSRILLRYPRRVVGERWSSMSASHRRATRRWCCHRPGACRLRLR